jgi:hypothetical protein
MKGGCIPVLSVSNTIYPISDRLVIDDNDEFNNDEYIGENDDVSIALILIMSIFNIPLSVLIPFLNIYVKTSMFNNPYVIGSWIGGSIDDLGMYIDMYLHIYKIQL